MADEMVMVGENGPRFEAPAVIASQTEKSALENPKPLGAAEMMGVFQSAGGHKVSAGLAQLVSGRVWPGRTRLGHRAYYDRTVHQVRNYFGENEGYCVLQMPKRCPPNASPPHSKGFASSRPFCTGARFWVAVAESAEETYGNYFAPA